MIVIDQLRISDDGTRMYINAHVNKASYFEGISIDSLIIMTADKVSEAASPYFPSEEYIYKKDDFGDNAKEVNLVLTPQDFLKIWEKEPEAMKFNRSDMSKTLFFVYIKCKHTQSGSISEECMPCILDEKTTLGVTFDENRLYQRVMNYTKDLVKDCSIPTGFMDFILLWKAFEASVETEHYVSAIKFFNMLFDNEKEYKGTVKGCGCHG